MKSPAFQWYPKQWLGDNKVQGMDWDAQAMHFHLINLAWQEEPPGSIPADEPLIRRWLRSPSEETWRRVRPQIFGAWVRSADGSRWVQKGLVEAAERQERYRRRYDDVKHRGKSDEKHAKNNGDSMKSEDVNEVVVGFDLESFDHEKAVREIQQAHPRPENSQANEIAVLEAIEHVVKQRQCKRQEAAEWLLSRTDMYRLATDNWPDKQFITKSTRWFTSRSFEEDPAFWERKHGNGKQDFRSEVSRVVRAVCGAGDGSDQGGMA